MVKRKKKPANLRTWGFGTKNLESELRRVEAYLAKENWIDALEVLQTLVEQQPQHKKIWGYMAEASFEIGNMQLYQKACEGLCRAAPNDASSAFQLGSAYLHNLHPLLALEAFERAVAIAPDHELAAKAKETLEQLTPQLTGVLEEMGLTQANGKEIAILHERGQAYLEQGDYAAAREAENQVLALHPDFLSAHNNLSLISWLEGDAEDAIAIAQHVLERDPDNIHALSNLVHYRVVVGQAEAAQPYGERLKASQADAWDGWTKKLEGLSYLADDAGVVEVFEQAVAAGVADSPAGAMFYHLAAVGLARTGDRVAAIAQWGKALELQPSLDLAADNLRDIRKPASQRHGAWPYSWEYWLPPKASADLMESLKTAKPLTTVDQIVPKIRAFLSRHPELLTLFPRILERGGPAGQQFVFGNAAQIRSPELLEMVKDFALSQSGTDQMRYQAAMLAVEVGLLAKDKVRLWMGGEWRELMLLAYEFHGELMYEHSKQVEKLLAQGTPLLRQRTKSQAEAAEALFMEALKLEPDAPDLKNNLAMAYLIQGREADSQALIDEVIERYPDYLFARAARAEALIDAGELDAAEALLKPFLKRDRFHFMEFSAFSEAYITLLLAQKQRDGARSWLQMWQQALPDDPRLARWKERLSAEPPLLK
ncbi:tetratricopeptide repeat protein [Romeria aff. gracilis LEGE 07310]|uniref:Tetratricopeptide repeat protein n=1 Tax=Vasconcelosia minhoensis LEGE 07310 TaxID=915328 RepID=A0A8J7AWL3_9CYAN|nr:tetratricopeptide repeat protein [Romeria gracilis]MBE9077202.1 tetratricopeptide repeat protein [Romeria aff. gracilis LEGE 07310]